MNVILINAIIYLQASTSDFLQISVIIYFCQTLSIPAFVRLIFSALRKSHHSLLIGVIVYILNCSFWKLDLFRSITLDICLNLTPLQSLALDYLLALYPFVLILLSYIFINIYDSKIACVVIMWKPFHKLFIPFRKSWDVRTSVIDSFSRFFLLSYIKIISATTDLLVTTEIYQLGSNTSTFGLYYSPSVAYLGVEHRPYAIMAIVVLTFFVIIPTIILLLYPFHFYRSFFLFFQSIGTFSMLFLTLFKVATRMGQSPEHLTVADFLYSI